MSTLLIRVATSPDYRAVERLLVEQHQYHAELHPDTMTPIERRLNKREFENILGAAGQDILVAQLGPQLIGLLWLIQRRLEGQGMVSLNVAFIQEIGVTAAKRKQGVGRQLIEAAMAWAEARELTRLEFNVWANNVEAQAFYRALGFDYLRHEMSKPVG